MSASRQWSTGGVHRAGLVGRAAERATVERVLTAARRGRGRVLLITGGAGIGKSRMLGEAARLAVDSGMTVLTGRAVEGGGTYRPIAEALVAHLRDADVIESADLRPHRAALQRIVPGWAGHDAGRLPVPAADPVLVLGEGIVRLLRLIAGDGGCLVRLEDLHWADADSEALIYLAGAHGSSGVVGAVQAAAVLGDVSDWRALPAVAGQDEQAVLDAVRDATRVHPPTVDDGGRLPLTPRADAGRDPGHPAAGG